MPCTINRRGRGGLHNDAFIRIFDRIFWGAARAYGSSGDGMGGAPGLAQASGPTRSYRFDSFRRNFYPARSRGAGGGQVAENTEPHGAPGSDCAHHHGRVDGGLRGGWEGAILGAVLGIIGGVVGCFSGFQARTRLVKALRTPDIYVALIEDILAIAGSLWAV